MECVDCLENYEVILDKFLKILRLYVIFELILSCVHILYSGADSLMYKMLLVHLCIKPRQIWQKPYRRKLFLRKTLDVKVHPLNAPPQKGKGNNRILQGKI